MKREIDAPRLVAGALAIFAVSVAALVAVPYFVLAQVKPAPGLKPYTAQQLRGRAVYIANGCVYCHSQQPRDARQAPDATRGWGRPSVAADYAYDKPHLLGTMRTGPDLFNIGARQPSESWHLGHLYQPRAYSAGSVMPAYRFLFVERAEPPSSDPNELRLPPSAAKTGVTVSTTQDARDLVAYLLAMDHTYPVLQR